jgi:hypothetical protein
MELIEVLQFVLSPLVQFFTGDITVHIREVLAGLAYRGSCVHASTRAFATAAIAVLVAIGLVAVALGAAVVAPTIPTLAITTVVTLGATVLPPTIPTLTITTVIPLGATVLPPTIPTLTITTVIPLGAAILPATLPSTTVITTVVRTLPPSESTVGVPAGLGLILTARALPLFAV